MTHLAVGGCCQKTVNDMKHVIITGIKAFINVKYLLVLAIHVGLVKNTQHLLKTVVNLTTQMRYLDNDTVVSKAVDKWIWQTLGHQIVVIVVGMATDIKYRLLNITDLVAKEIDRDHGNGISLWTLGQDVLRIGVMNS